jgi:hypothetical protein
MCCVDPKYLGCVEPLYKIAKCRHSHLSLVQAYLTPALPSKEDIMYFLTFHLLVHE